LKFGVWSITEKLWPRLEEALKERAGDVQFREWSFLGSPASRETRIKEPENNMICVSGSAGPFGITYTITFGYGAAHFVTKPIKSPVNWEEM